MINLNNRKPPKRVVLLNDTRRDTGHHGCLVVMQTLQALCDRYNLEVAYSLQSIQPDFSIKYFKAILSNIDLVIVNGEGTLHDDAGTGIYQRCQLAHDMKKKIFLINAVWQNNTQNLELFDHVFTRESLSTEQILKTRYTRVQTVADLSFYYHKIIKPHIKISAEDRTVFTDGVSADKSKQLLQQAYANNSDFYHMSNYHFRAIQNLFSKPEIAVDPQLSTFFENKCKLITDLDLLSSSLVVTGRFHVSCFCISVGRRFLAIPSNTHKIQGLVKDCGLAEDDFIIDNIASFSLERIHQDENDYTQCCSSYTENAVKSIEAMFDQIVNS